MDVSNWRSARAASDARWGRVRVPGGAPGGVNAGHHPAPPLRVEVTLAPAHDAAVAAALAGSGLDTFTARCVLEYDAGAMLHDAPRTNGSDRRWNEGGWFPSERGEWHEMRLARRDVTGGVDGGGGSNDANDAREGRKPRIRVRARLAEGLDLRPPRRGGGSDRDEDAKNVGHAVGHTVGHIGSSSTASSSGGGEGLRLVRVRQLELVWWSRNSGAACEASAWAPVCPPGTVSLGTALVPSFRAPTEAFVVRAPWIRIDTTATAAAAAAAAPRPARTRSPRRTRRPPPIGGRRWRPPSASTASTATPGRGSGRTLASAPSRSGARAPRPATSPSATSSRPITIRRSRPKSRAFAPISRARPRPPRRRCGPRRAPRLSSDACPSRFTGRGCARARGGWRWRRATPGTSSPRRRRLRFVGISIRRRGGCGWTTRMNRRARVQAPATGPKPRPPPRRSRGSRCPPTARGRPWAPGVWEPPPPSRWERAPRDPPRSSWTGGAGASAGRAC